MATVFQSIADATVQQLSALELSNTRMLQLGINTADFRNWLTSPSNGIQTFVGSALAAISAEYRKIQSAGVLTVQIKQDAITAVERIRAAFEAIVNLFQSTQASTVRGAIDSVNATAQQMKQSITADPLPDGTTGVGQLAAAGSSAGSSGLQAGSSYLWLLVAGLAVILLLPKK